MVLTDLVIMPGTDYQAICDAVRAKTGGTDLLKSGDIPVQIEGIRDVLYMNAALLDAGGAYPGGDRAAEYKTIVIPEEATFVSLNALDNFPNVETVIINGNCEIELYNEYDSNTKTYSYKNFLTVNNNNALIKRLEIHNRMKVDDYLAYGLASLREVIIGDGVVEMGNYCFFSCGHLERLVVGKDVGKLFGVRDCKYLNSIVFCSDATVCDPDSVYGGYPTFVCAEEGSLAKSFFESYCTIETIGFSEDEMILYLDADLLNAGGVYPVSYPNDYTTVVIPDTATFVDFEAFKNFPKLRKIIVNGNCEFERISWYDSSKVIHFDNVFNVNSLITDIEFNNRIFQLNDLHSCHSVKNIKISGNADSNGTYAFNKCGALEHIVFAADVSIIETLFNTGGFGKLKSVTILSPAAEFPYTGGGVMFFTNIPETVTIRGYSGSTAEAIALELGRPFEAID